MIYEVTVFKWKRPVKGKVLQLHLCRTIINTPPRHQILVAKSPDRSGLIKGHRITVRQFALVDENDPGFKTNQKSLRSTWTLHSTRGVTSSLLSCSGTASSYDWCKASTKDSPPTRALRCWGFCKHGLDPAEHHPLTALHGKEEVDVLDASFVGVVVEKIRGLLVSASLWYLYDLVMQLLEQENILALTFPSFTTVSQVPVSGIQDKAEDKSKNLDQFKKEERRRSSKSF